MSLQEKYDAFAKKHGCEPIYASAIVQWKEPGMLGAYEDVIIKLSKDTDEQDDEILYYANGIQELEELTKDTGEDFFVLEQTVSFLISID